MKLCKNCRRMSRDDDFCSHCGAAVYDENDHSSNDYIKCDNYKGHTHEKQTFTDRPIINGPDYKGRVFTKMSDANRRKKGKGCSSLITFIILLFFLLSFFDSMGVSLSELLDAVLEMLSDAV